MTLVFIIISILLLSYLVLITKKLRNTIAHKERLQARFNYLQRLSKTGYFDGNFSDEYVWWSDELNKLIGLEPDDYITSKKEALEFIYEEDRGNYIIALENSIKTGDGFAQEFRAKHKKTGELKYYKINAEIIKDKNGNPYELRGTVRDINEKRIIKQALYESEVKQANVMSNIDDLVFVLDNDGVFIEFYSSAADDELYVSPDKFINKHHSEVLPQEVSEKFENTINMIDLDGKSRKFDYSLKINEEVRWNNVKVSVFKDEKGNKNGYIVVARDITTRKQIEDKLSESEMRFRELTELLPVAVFEIDKNYSINYVNKKGFEWFKYSEQDFEKGISILDLFVDNDKKNLVSNIERRLDNEDIGAVEYKAKTKNGEIFDVLIFATPIISDEQFIGIRGVLMDISDRKKYLKELEKFSKFESLGILAGGIAHNFKNILAAVILSVDIIKLDPKSIEKQLKRISASLEQANALATRFQTFTKSNEPSLEEININKVLEEAIEIAFAGSQYSVISKFDINLTKTLADSKQLNEVFLNLLINAIQAMREGGELIANTSQVYIKDNEIPNLSQGEYIKISIIDNGIGMSEEQLEQIFTPFYTTKKEGHGLGLVTVFSIIKSHNGSIQIESELNKGTKFDIYLPIIINNKNNQSTILSSGNINDEMIKVVLVDDDINITESLNEISGLVNKIDLKTFNNPYEAIQYMKLKSPKELFEVAILDMTFVGYNINGIELLQRIKEYYPDIKSLVFSGHSSKPIVSNYFEYGFDARLEKPCNFQQLIDKVYEVINTKKRLID